MTDERRNPEESSVQEHETNLASPAEPDAGRREPSLSHRDDVSDEEPDYSQRDDGSDENPGHTPYVERRKRWNPLRLSFLVLGAVIVLGLVYFLFFADSEPEGPTVESRVQSQQQVIDQLRVSIEELQSGQDERRSEAEGASNRMGEIASRLDDLEERRQGSPLQALPERVQALSHRIDELSNSVDMRFSAAQEKEQSLEASIEEVRKLRASQKTSAQESQPSGQRQADRKPEPPSPPFSVSGVELRGGRSYLTVASGNAGRLSDLRLVAVGQNIGQWHLSSIDGHSAAFTINGQTVVVPVP